MVERALMRRRRLWIGLILLATLYGAIIVPRAAKDDFLDFHRAGRAVLEGRSPYQDPSYLYPPVVAYAFAPLALMPPLAASAVWYALSLIALAAIAVVSVEAVTGSVCATASRYVLPLVAAARPWTNNLEHGQTNLMIAALLALAFRAGRRGGHARAGALAAAAGTIKLFPYVSLLYFITRHGARAVLAAALAVTVLLWALPSLRVGIANTSQIAAFRTRTLDRFAPGRAVQPGSWNQSLAALVVRVAPASAEQRTIGHATAIVQATVVVFLAIVLWRSRSRGPAGDRVADFAAFSACLAAMPLISGLSWKAHFTMLVPGWFALLAPESWVGRVSARTSRQVRAVALGTGLALVLAADGLVGRRVAEGFERLSGFTIAGLVVFGLLLFLAARPRAGRPADRRQFALAAATHESSALSTPRACPPRSGAGAPRGRARG
jgi:arabinofuranan 3-O-arabinosyltransferase